MKSKSVILAALALSIVLAPVAAPAQDAEQSPSITIESITVEPASPAADTLCKLTVTLSNQGTYFSSCICPILTHLGITLGFGQI